jgi:hypothetical protein
MSDMISYDQAIIAAATQMVSEPYNNVRFISDVIALMFEKGRGEVRTDLRAELKEQRRGL